MKFTPQRVKSVHSIDGVNWSELFTRLFFFFREYAYTPVQEMPEARCTLSLCLSPVTLEPPRRWSEVGQRILTNTRAQRRLETLQENKL